MLNKEFYINYGKVAYAMAMADGQVEDKERNIFMDMVRSKLVPLEKAVDEYGTNVAYYSDFAFESEEEDIHDSVEEAYESFLLFISTHKIHPGEAVKGALLDIIQQVAKVYGRVTQGEQDLLVRFEKKMRAMKA